MIPPVWTEFDSNNSESWPKLDKSVTTSKIWPNSACVLLVYGKKHGQRKNSYHWAINLGNGKFCWPIESVVAWSKGPLTPDGENPNGFPVNWIQREQVEPSCSKAVLVLCSYMTDKLYWGISHYNSERHEWSAEKSPKCTVVFWAEIPSFSG